MPSALQKFRWRHAAHAACFELLIRRYMIYMPAFALFISCFAILSFAIFSNIIYAARHCAAICPERYLIFAIIGDMMTLRHVYDYDMLT